MTTLKSKIKVIPPLPNTINKKNKLKKIIATIITIILITIISYITYIQLLPYINAINIKNIIGKKIYITDCNTKDYIIINSNKTYSLKITDNNCNQNTYEGTIIIKYNEITFKNDTKNIIGLIDSNYNIIINNNKYESDKNE